jgi:hypothetical protein
VERLRRFRRGAAEPSQTAQTVCAPPAAATIAATTTAATNAAATDAPPQRSAAIRALPGRRQWVRGYHRLLRLRSILVARAAGEAEHHGESECDHWEYDHYTGSGSPRRAHPGVCTVGGTAPACCGGGLWHNKLHGQARDMREAHGRKRPDAAC